MSRHRRRGLGDFRPGLESANAAGIKTSRAPYPEGAAGVRISLEEMARRIREGQSDPDVIKLAASILKTKGFTGRGANAGNTRQRVSALLDYVRENILYAPDAPGTERIASAAALLCLRPNLCIQVGDCDDNSVALGSLIGSIGVPVVVLKQNYGAQHQEHVLIEFQDDSGAWLPADPSTDMPLGQKVHAVEEVRVDPLDQVGETGTAGAEIITLGAPKMTSEKPSAVFAHGRWWSLDGRYVHTGLGWVSLENQVGLGFCDFDTMHAFRVRLLPRWEALKVDVDENCPALSPDQRFAFHADYLGFRTWSDNMPPSRVFCADEERAYIEAGRDYESRLANWVAFLKGVNCKPSAPDLPPLTPDDPRSRDYNLDQPPGGSTYDEIKKAAVAVGIVAAAGVGVYVLMPVVRAGAESLAASLRRRARK